MKNPWDVLSTLSKPGKHLLHQIRRVWGSLFLTVVNQFFGPNQPTTSLNNHQCLKSSHPHNLGSSKKKTPSQEKKKDTPRKTKIDHQKKIMHEDVSPY